MKQIPRIRALAVLFVLATATVDAQDLNNPELAHMAQADQSDRSERPGGTWDDTARRHRVLELLAVGAVLTPQDRLHAALILQHTPAALCEGQLGSFSVENYLLAHRLAEAAWRDGLESAGPLVAQTIDRYLAFTEGRQRYGTTQLVDLETGESYLPTIDRSITDAQRAELGLAPLAQILERWPERAPPAISTQAKNPTADE